MYVPADIARIARSWQGDVVFEAAARRSQQQPFGPPRPVTVGGMQQVRQGTLDTVIEATSNLTGRWRQTPLAVVDLGRGYWLVAQTHRDGRLFQPTDARPGLWMYQFGGPPELAAVVDHLGGGALQVMRVGRYA